MERCRTEFLRALGYHKAAISDDGQLWDVPSAKIDYLRPARLGGILSVIISINKLARHIWNLTAGCPRLRNFVLS